MSSKEKNIVARWRRNRTWIFRSRLSL